MRDVPEPGELLYRPRPSWAPPLFAAGVALAVCGAFVDEFMVAGWVYAILGGVLLLAALRTLVRGATREHFRLPRRQKVRGAVLPVETIRPPTD